MNYSSTSDEPHVILTTKPTLVKMSKTNSETGRETANFRIKCKEFSVKVKHFTEARTETKISDSSKL